MHGLRFFNLIQNFRVVRLFAKGNSIKGNCFSVTVQFSCSLGIFSNANSQPPILQKYLSQKLLKKRIKISPFLTLPTLSSIYEVVDLQNLPVLRKF